MLEQLKSDLSYLQHLEHCNNECTKNIQSFTNQIEKLNTTYKMQVNALEHYKQAAEILQYQRLEDVLKFVNEGLAYIYWDEQYEIRVELSDKYTRAMTLLLYDGKRDLIRPLRKGTGKGVRAVACYLQEVYFNCELGATVLWQDETLVNISPGYVERLFNYVRLVCETRNITQVMITQDSRFIKYGHLIYSINKGNLSSVEGE